jgi:DNA-binding CsgD family transcriptional regulator
MTAPSQYLRQKREEASRRRLEIAKLLREDPKATNKELARALGVNRDTIALDRKAIMEQLQKDTKTEVELLRQEMVQKLEGLEAEVELHRKDGKLSLSAIDQMLSITKAVIELTGCRRPVVEKTEVRNKTRIEFATTVVKTDPKFIKAEVIKEPLTLEAGHEQR